MKAFVMAGAAALTLQGCGPQPSQTENGAASATHETTNQRLARQKRYVAGLNRHILPAPEGEPATVALRAIGKSENACSKISKASRLDGDGTIIVTCADGNKYRIFNVEGVIETMPLKCRVAIEVYGVDPCDETIAGTEADKSLETVLIGLKRDSG